MLSRALPIAVVILSALSGVIVVRASGPREAPALAASTDSAAPAAADAADAAAPPAKLAFAEPGISPDGREIAFVSGGDIWTTAVTGGEARLLVSHAATEARPLYAPDGRSLAFVSTRTGNGDLYVLTLDTGDLRRLTYDDSPEMVNGWSPDGRWLFFSSASQDVGGMADIFRISVEGGTAMPVTGDPYLNEFFGTVAPGGERIAFSARGIASNQWWRRGHSHIDESELWTMTLGAAPASSGASTATNARPAGTASASTNARAAGGASAAGGGNGGETSEANATSGGARSEQVTPRGGAARSGATTMSGAARYEQVTPRGAKALWPMWSADGRTLFYVSDRGGHENIWRVTIMATEASASPAPVRTNAPAAADASALRRASAPDAAVAKSAANRGAAVAGHAAAAQTPEPSAGSAVTSFRDGRVLWPTISRDGRTIAFERDFAIWTLDTTSGKATPLTIARRGAPAGTGVEHSRLTTGFVDLSLSPDGKKVAFAARGDLFAASAKDGGDATRITATSAVDTTPAWTPDIRRLVYVAELGTTSELHIYDFGAAGTARVDTTLTTGHRDYAPSLAPNGEQVAFLRGASELCVVRLGAATPSTAAPGGPSSSAAPPSAPNSSATSHIDSPSAALSSATTTRGAAPSSGASSGASARDAAPPGDSSVDASRRAAQSGASSAPSDGGTVRCLAKVAVPASLDASQVIAWSPDSRWIAFMASGAKGFTNAQVIAAGGGDAKPVSFLANVGGDSLAWSPDGTFLLFNTGQRTEQGQVARVDLVLRTPKFREDQFRELFPSQPSTPDRPSPDRVDDTAKPSTLPSPATSPPSSPSSPSSPTPATPSPTRTEQTHTDKPSPDHRPAETRSADAGAKPDAKPAPPKKPTDIVFDDIRQRLGYVPVGLDVNALAISPDGKTLLVTASNGGQQNLYTYGLDELARERPVARQLTSTAGNKGDAQFSPDSREVYYLDDGRIQIVAIDRREPRPLAVTAELDVDFGAERNAVFTQAWSMLDEHFYDPAFHGAAWSQLRGRYAPYAAGASNADELRRIVNLMIGELNASHLGMNPPPNPGATTGRLGVRFDRDEHARSGRLTIAGIVPLGPAAVTRAIAAGDTIVAINGTPIARTTNLDRLLDHTVGKRAALTIESKGQRRDVAVLPVNLATERGLVYRQWVESRRAYVAKISGGRLGYVHMPDMGAASLAQLYVDLDVENHAREGVVIDVRNNNGGFVNAYALDVFTRRPYLNMTLRGRPTAPARGILGQRALESPTVLVTNQHSLSDAEDFTEGYRRLKLGRVVGEPTAGWIIYTWNTRLLDGSVLRLPRMRITDTDGKNMELAPRPVDVTAVRRLGEAAAGRDTQLDVAVRELLAQLGTSGPRRTPTTQSLP